MVRSFQRTACRCYSLTEPKRRPSKNEPDKGYKYESFLAKEDTPPLMDFLRELHKDTVQKDRVRDWDPDQTEIENKYEYHDSTLSDDLRSQPRGISANDTGDLEAKLLRQSELDKYQMMSQNDMRRRSRLTTTTHNTSAVRGNKSVSYTKKTTQDSSGSFSSSTTTIVTSMGDYHSDVGEDFDDINDEDDDEDDIWGDDSDSDDNVVPAEVISTKTNHLSSGKPIPTPTSKKTSSSSWSISLNDDEEDDMNSQNFTRSSSSNNAKPEEPDEYKVFYEWDHDNAVMKPLLMKPRQNAHQQSDLDDKSRTAQDEEFGAVPENLQGDEREFVKMIGKDIEGMIDDDDDILSGIPSRYHQPWNEDFAPRKLENWWDRDPDLIDKDKRKLKLQNLRNAQTNPLHMKCKTCPICKREWKGHKSMVNHVLNKEVCFKQLDETLKEQLTAQNIDMKKKKKRKNEYPFEL
jgi:hypothetical protein